MIIWLGSYPRAGITALRMALHRGFGLPSYSLDYDYLEHTPGKGAALGFQAHGMTQRAFLAHADASPELFLTKTFGTPTNLGEKAIYLVRDGRANLYSYWNFLQHYVRPDGGRVTSTPPSLEEVVVGHTPVGSWSQHVEDWTAPGPNVLIIRYERLLQGDRQTLAEAAEFLGRKPLVRDLEMDLAILHSNGEQVRYESDEEGIAAVEALCPDLFETAHGEVMRQLGYADPSPPAKLRA